MGEIVDSKASNGKVLYRMEFSLDEVSQLRNHFKNVHLFSADSCIFPTRIIQRGHNGGAKYFSIPLSLKSRKKKNFSKVSYQKLEIGNKIYYICVAYKDLLFG